MKTYITTAGFFDLNASNSNVGSYISKYDVLEMFNYDSAFQGQLVLDDLNDLPFQVINGAQYIDESKLHEAWHKGQIKNVIPKRGSSLDEIILFALIKKTLPEAEIEKQVQIGRYKMDLKVCYQNKTVFIEFDGPSHFCISRYGVPKHEPFYKKHLIEDKTGFEVINWAFWIQRCSANIEAIFEKNIQGLGALWSTNFLFGDFYFTNSAEYIEAINQRFNIMQNDGYGYFYDLNPFGVKKPEHPIISSVIKEPAKISRLLPKGYQTPSVWLPSKLLHLIE